MCCVCLVTPFFSQKERGKTQACRPPLLPVRRHQLQTEPVVPGTCSHPCWPACNSDVVMSCRWLGERMMEQSSDSFLALQRYSHNLIQVYESEGQIHTVFSVWKFRQKVSVKHLFTTLESYSAVYRPFAKLWWNSSFLCDFQGRQVPDGKAVL